MKTPELDDMGGIRAAVEPAWHHFLDAYEGQRPELYRYCRHLSRSPSPEL
jgi:RNA polymerase sigma-70 factor, ECF subfamily